MKKIFIGLFIIITIVFTMKPVKAAAATIPNNDLQSLTLISSEIVYLNDGSFIVTNISKVNTQNTVNLFILGATTSVVGYMEVINSKSNGDIIWCYTLTGYYYVTEGVSSLSYKAEYSQYINDSSWSFSKGSATYTEDYVRGTGTFTDKFLFITTQTVNIDITMYCDEFGNLYW